MKKEKRHLRVLVAKPGLDGHDRGAKVGARMLRDAGMEVIYTGLRQTAEQIAEAAVQEDVDVAVLSVLSGAHMSLTEKFLESLAARDAERIPTVVVGTIPHRDIERLKELGARGAFPAGSRYEEIVDFVRDIAE